MVIFGLDSVHLLDLPYPWPRVDPNFYRVPYALLLMPSQMPNGAARAAAGEEPRQLRGPGPRLSARTIPRSPSLRRIPIEVSSALKAYYMTALEPVVVHASGAGVECYAQAIERSRVWPGVCIDEVVVSPGMVCWPVFRICCYAQTWQCVVLLQHPQVGKP